MTETHGADALLNPRNIVLVGASDRPRHWSGRVFENLKRFGYAGGIYPVNPKRDEIWGIPCYPDVASLPEPPDHVLSFVPAPVTFGVLEDAAAAGARSALVFAGGFGEGGDPEGRARAQRLRAIVEETGLALCGPNCMGNYSAPSRAITLPDDGLERLVEGPTMVIAQSGGMSVALNRILAERGLESSYLVSCGNQLGLGAGDYIRFAADDDRVRVIMLYLEQVVRCDEFIAACEAADAAGKPVVAVKIGGSDAGRAAALAHTGALVGSVDAFDAVAGAAGVVRCDTFEDGVEAIEYLSRCKPPAGPGVGVLTNSGALKSLISESAARAGLNFATLSEETLSRIAEALGPEGMADNPLDSRQTLVTESYLACAHALAEDASVDVLLVAEEIPSKPGIERKEKNLAALAKWTKAGTPVPVAMFTPITVAFTDHAKALRATFAHVPLIMEPERTFRVLSRILDAHGRRRRALSASAPTPGAATSTPEMEAGALNEVQSKALLAAYGIEGLPVVVKALSADLPHKTEAGAIALDLHDEAAVIAACEDITASVAAAAPQARLEGFLVAEQVRGGAELALGIARDAEMGPVVMFGTGGINLELYRDVAFGRPGLNPAEAEAMIDATHAGALLAGFRGAPALDRAAVVAAITGLGRLAADAGARLVAVDINPLIARPEGQGAVALDALVIGEAPA
jgi:acetyltransferase